MYVKVSPENIRISGKKKESQTGNPNGWWNNTGDKPPY